MDITCKNQFYDKYVTSTFDIAYALSRALDLVNPLINNHHQRVAYIAGSIAKQAGYSKEEIELTILASLLHDIGVVVEKEFHELVTTDEKYERELSHVIVGSYLLKDFHIFEGIDKLIKYHHTPYKIKDNFLSTDEEVPELAGIIHLADRIDILLKRERPALEQQEHIVENIRSQHPDKFNPKHLKAFYELSDMEFFWFNIEEQEKYRLIKYDFEFSLLNMTMDDILEIAKLLSRIIDFRCIFTATHSAGVAASAFELAQLIGMDKTEAKAAMIAGYLHDIGKLAIPSEILYKTDKLNKDEIDILRKHPYYTYTILNYFQIFETIKDWASFHHEYVNGSGYPFHFQGKKLCTGSRLITICDIFTAMTEERPYRQCEPKENLMQYLIKMSEKEMLDKDIIEVLIKNYDHMFEVRANAQKEAFMHFEEFRDEILSNEALKRDSKYISVLHI